MFAFTRSNTRWLLCRSPDPAPPACGAGLPPIDGEIEFAAGLGAAAAATFGAAGETAGFCCLPAGILKESSFNALHPGKPSWNCLRSLPYDVAPHHKRAQLKRLPPRCDAPCRLSAPQNSRAPVSLCNLSVASGSVNSTNRQEKVVRLDGETCPAGQAKKIGRRNLERIAKRWKLNPRRLDRGTRSRARPPDEFSPPDIRLAFRRARTESRPESRVYPFPPPKSRCSHSDPARPV